MNRYSDSMNNCWDEAKNSTNCFDEETRYCSPVTNSFVKM